MQGIYVFAQTVTAEGVIEAAGELGENAAAIVRTFPPIIANNYALILGALFIFAAFHLLRKSLSAILTITAVAVIVTVLTNAGLMPNLNEVWATVSNIFALTRAIPHR